MMKALTTAQKKRLRRCGTEEKVILKHARIADVVVYRQYMSFRLENPQKLLKSVLSAKNSQRLRMKNKNIIILCIIVSLICLVSTITLALHMSFIIVLRYWWAFLIEMVLFGSALIFCVILYISDLIGRKKSKNKKDKSYKMWRKS